MISVREKLDEFNQLLDLVESLLLEKVSREVIYSVLKDAAFCYWKLSLNFLKTQAEFTLNHKEFDEEEIYDGYSNMVSFNDSTARFAAITEVFDNYN